LSELIICQQCGHLKGMRKGALYCSNRCRKTAWLSKQAARDLSVLLGYVSVPKSIVAEKSGVEE
jgi:hypothetical protein